METIVEATFVSDALVLVMHNTRHCRPESQQPAVQTLQNHHTNWERYSGNLRALEKDGKPDLSILCRAVLFFPAYLCAKWAECCVLLQISS
eukprot:544138-Amphidinium_carterae.2